MRTQPTPTVAVPPAPSAADLRILYLQRRYRLSPSLAAALAGLAYAPAPTWQERRA